MHAFISTLTSIAVLLHIWLGCEVHHAAAHEAQSMAEITRVECEHPDSSPAHESDETSCDECACTFRDAGKVVQQFWPPDGVALTTVGSESPLSGTHQLAPALEDHSASSAGKFSVLYCVMRN